MLDGSCWREGGKSLLSTTEAAGIQAELQTIRWVIGAYRETEKTYELKNPGEGQRQIFPVVPDINSNCFKIV